MAGREPKLLVFDGDCSLCRAAAAGFEKRGWVAPGCARPYESFSEAIRERLDAVGFRNEMAIFAPESGEIRTGMAGLLWALGDSRPALSRLGSTWPFSAFLGVGYRMIAANRRILAPRPNPQIACACDPDPAPRQNLLLAVCLVLLGLLMSAVAGGVLAQPFGVLSGWEGAAYALFVVVPGWCLFVLATLFRVRREHRAPWVGQVAMVAARGVVPTFFAAFAARSAWSLGAPKWVLGTILALGVAVSMGGMTGDLRRRLPAVFLPTQTFFGWLLALWGWSIPATLWLWTAIG